MGYKKSRHRRIYLLALEIWHVDLETARRIFVQPDFVGRGATGNVDSVALAHHSDDGAGIGPRTLAIVDTARGIDVEAGENFGRGLVKTQNDLNSTIRILRMDRNWHPNENLSPELWTSNVLVCLVRTHVTSQGMESRTAP